MGNKTESIMELIKEPDTLGMIKQKPWERETQIKAPWGGSDQETCCKTS